MFFIGDTHGNFKTLTFIIREGWRDSVLIQVGDFGVGFGGSTKLNSFKLQEINAKFADLNNMLYVVRGNHDNPNWWNDTYDFSNIKFVKDFEVLEIESKRILVIGGGISIDRTNRFENINYWKNENIQKVEEIDCDIDFVVSHVPPKDIFVDLYNTSGIAYWLKKDNNLKNDLLEEQKLLNEYKNKILQFNKLKYWISGHMHIGQNRKVDGITYVILGIDEIREI